MPSLLCTERDVLDLIPQLYDESTDTWSVYSARRLRGFILRSDGIIRTALRATYGADLTSGITPWASIPETDEDNDAGSGELLPDITVDADAITEVWTLTFTSTTEYNIVGSLSGSQGTGATGSDSASTNGYITVPTANWSGTFAIGDVFYVRTYDIEAAVVEMSALMASGVVLQSRYTEFVPNRSEISREYMEEARKRVDQVTDGDSPYALEVGRSARDIDPIQVDWEIDAYGNNITDYAETEWDPS